MESLSSAQWNYRILHKAHKTELSRDTVDAYVSALRKLYVFEDLPA